MTPENFTYWLNGFVELNGTPPTPEQWDCIKEHLNLLVFLSGISILSLLVRVLYQPI